MRESCLCSAGKQSTRGLIVTFLLDFRVLKMVHEIQCAALRHLRSTGEAEKGGAQGQDTSMNGKHVEWHAMDALWLPCFAYADHSPHCML